MAQLIINDSLNEEKQMLSRQTNFPSTHLLNPVPDSRTGLRQYFINLSQEARKQDFADTSGVAEMTGLSRQTIVNWVREGNILAFRMGKKKYLILKSSVSAWLKKCEEQQEVEGVIRKPKSISKAKTRE